MCVCVCVCPFVCTCMCLSMCECVCVLSSALSLGSYYPSRRWSNGNECRPVRLIGQHVLFIQVGNKTLITQLFRWVIKH